MQFIYFRPSPVCEKLVTQISNSEAVQNRKVKGQNLGNSLKSKALIPIQYFTLSHRVDRKRLAASPRKSLQSWVPRNSPDTGTRKKSRAIKSKEFPHLWIYKYNYLQPSKTVFGVGF